MLHKPLWLNKIIQKGKQQHPDTLSKVFIIPPKDYYKTDSPVPYSAFKVGYVCCIPEDNTILLDHDIINYYTHKEIEAVLFHEFGHLLDSKIFSGYYDLFCHHIIENKADLWVDKLGGEKRALCTYLVKISKKFDINMYKATRNHPSVYNRCKSLGFHLQDIIKEVEYYEHR